MIQILLSEYTFDQQWGISRLISSYPQGYEVMMLPMSFNDGWSSEFLTWEDMFQKGKETYEMMVRPFKNFGIREKNISWLNYFQDTSTAAKKMIAQADIVVLSGESPAWIMQRIEDNS